MVYNNEAFIERTLLSILENDTKSFDIIINDDYSTDNSVYVIKRFLSEHKAETKKWALNVNKVNLGINRSIKNILATYKNNWVKYIAGDDEFESGSLAKYYQLATINNYVSSIILSDMNVIDSDSKFISKRKSLSPFLYQNSWLKSTNLYINTINAPTVMIGRESLLSALDQTKVKNAEDWPVLRFCISRNFAFKVYRKPLIKYRIHHRSLSSSYNLPTDTKKKVNKIRDQVEILLRENALESSRLSVKLGVYIQIRQLNARSRLERNFFKILKLANPQFCFFKAMSMMSMIKK